ncbi:MAG: GNAT family N-acetyltransferase [Methylobacteriaceae bacterium]|nr:GNAT family N-acetyltransferase [Methylobacteriaceae bacterium]
MSHAAAEEAAPPALERAPPFAGVEVFADLRAAQADWAELESAAPHAAYQRRDWALPWLGSLGRAQGVSPAITVARNAAGRPIALLPLGVMARGPLRLAEFIGGKDANFTFGLFRPGVAWRAPDLAALMRAAAAATPGGVDLYALVNQPYAWDGQPNPMQALRHQSAPSAGYKANLSGSGEAFLRARLSGESRKKIRKKEARLAEFGPIRHLTARSADEARAILAVFAAQKAQRMRDKGLDNVFEGAGADEFLTRVAVEPLERGATPAVELHALAAGERIVATFAGAPCGRRFSGMFNSFELDPEISRTSPGDLLLARLMAMKCDEGYTVFDLGVGEARYKKTFCDAEETLFDAYVPSTAAGAALMWVKAAKRMAKRRIKHDPRLWRMVETVRRWRA